MDANVDKLIAIGLAIVVLIAVNATFRSFRKSRKDVAWFESLPDLGAYLASHPACRTSVGPICHVCSSNQFDRSTFHQWTAFGWKPIGLTHYCRKCQTVLYRTGL